MKKNRNLIKIFLTLVQIFVLGLPLFAFCFNAVAYRLGLKDLATSVSGNTESSIDESTFLNETNDINKFALQSIYDFNYISGIENIDYNYQPLYETNEPIYNNGVLDIDSLINGNIYEITYDFTSDINSSFDIINVTSNSYLFFVPYCDESTYYVSYILNNDISYYSRISLGDTNNTGYIIRFFHVGSTAFDFCLYYRTSASYRSYKFLIVLNDKNDLINTDKFTISSVPIENIPFTTDLQVYNVADIPSFISATEGMSYEEIVSNNYVNTHLLLNLDIVGLFTNNLSGNAYVYLWLNYFMNYLLTMSIVFICFDVIMYFILIVRKILDRSVEYTDRREF